MYWGEWARLRDVLVSRGKTHTQVEEHRHALTVRALGVAKSSKAFSNADLDRVLARIRAEREPANLDAQLALEDSPEKRRAYLLDRLDRACWAMYADGGDNRMAQPETRLRYIAGTARNVIGKDPDDCTDAELGKVLGCLEARVARLQAKRGAGANPF